MSNHRSYADNVKVVAVRPIGLLYVTVYDENVAQIKF